MKMLAFLMLAAVAMAVEDTAEKAERLEKLAHELGKRLNDADAENKMLKNQHKELFASLQNVIDSQMAPGDVAFAAELTRTVGPNAQDTVIPYGRVTVNEGGAYDGGSATFTASAAGTYFFQWSTMTAPNGHSCSYMVVNGQPEDGAGATGNYGITSNWGYGSQSALMNLNSGDSIQIRLGDHSDCQAVYNNERSMQRTCSFKGFLVKNM